MSWLKFDCATPEKPEVLRITIAMGWTDPDMTVGKLLKVWRWFDAHSVDGNAPGVTLALLDRLIGVTGLARAMTDAGWLAVTDDGLSLPNFENHNGKTAKDRALTAKRAANHRSNGKSNANSVTTALPREEKRREEKKEDIEPTALVAAAENSASNDLLGNVVSMPKRIPCPYERIVEVFHEECPSLPRIAMLSDKRKKHLAARWSGVDEKAKFTSAEDGLQIFGDVFRKAHASNFLSGRNGAWKASFDWLIESETNFLKVVEGNYDNDQRAQK